MFKRARWAGVGYVAGVGTSVYVAVRLRNSVRAMTQHATAQAVADRVGTGVVQAGERVRDAATAGRDAMRRREDELRRAIEAR